jgi:hypothetical protein
MPSALPSSDVEIYDLVEKAVTERREALCA